MPSVSATNTFQPERLRSLGSRLSCPSRGRDRSYTDRCLSAAALGAPGCRPKRGSSENSGQRAVGSGTLGELFEDLALRYRAARTQADHAVQLVTQPDQLRDLRLDVGQVAEGDVGDFLARRLRPIAQREERANLLGLEPEPAGAADKSQPLQVLEIVRSTTRRRSVRAVRRCREAVN